MGGGGTVYAQGQGGFQGFGSYGGVGWQGAYPANYGAGGGPAPSYPGGYAPAGYKDPSGKYSSIGGAQGAGIVTGGIMTGYSQFQSAEAGGVGTGQAAASGIMTGAGSIAMMGAVANWGATGALLGMGPVGWAILGALAIVGGIMLGSGGKEEEYRKVETKESMNQISSRIDISNNHLEWVNRNLVALRQELTFIMQRSYYFRERDEVENFAIGSMRGAA